MLFFGGLVIMQNTASTTRNMLEVLNGLIAKVVEEGERTADTYQEYTQNKEKTIIEMAERISALEGRLLLVDAEKVQQAATYEAHINEINAKWQNEKGVLASQIATQDNTIAALQQQINTMRATHDQQMASILSAIKSCPNFNDAYWNMDLDPLLGHLQYRRGQHVEWEQKTVKLTQKKI